MINKFQERVVLCTPATREILAFLRQAAAHAGEDVGAPTFDGRNDTGISYRRRGKRFCRFDPKPRADHVWAWIPGADRRELAASGTVAKRDDGPWVTIKDMRGAVRLVPEILRAYDAIERGAGALA